MNAPHYAITVGGHLADQWSDSLGGLTVARNDDGTSTLAGPIVDEAELHGILNRLRDIGLSLLELRRA